jgi:hypothetical protein
MGYDATVFLLCMFSFVPVVIVTVILCFVAMALRVLPGGMKALPGIGIIFCGCYMPLLSYVTWETMRVEPERLQAEYLGKAYGSPLTLRWFEHDGFMDPRSQWEYALSDDDRVALTKRCVWQRGFDRQPTCLLYSGEDKRWSATVTLDGDRLHMIDGLH